MSSLRCMSTLQLLQEALTLGGDDGGPFRPRWILEMAAQDLGVVSSALQANKIDMDAVVNCVDRIRTSIEVVAEFYRREEPESEEGIKAPEQKGPAKAPSSPPPSSKRQKKRSAA